MGKSLLKLMTSKINSCHFRNFQKTKKINILHIITESNLGGAQRNTLLTIRGLKDKGYNVELACGAYGPGKPLALAEEAEKYGIRTHILHSVKREVNIFDDIQAFQDIYKIIKSGNFHIVHTHSTKIGFMGRLAAKILQVPIIIHTIHGVPFPIDNRNLKVKVYLLLERAFAKISNHLIAVGKLLEDEFIELKVVRINQIKTIYSGINFSRFDRVYDSANKKRELGLDDTDCIIGFVGRLSEQKAPYYLVDAASLICKEVQNVHFVLVGEGPLRPILEAQIKELELDRKVTLLGERTDVPELLDIFDIFALPTKWEGVGRAMTEAMYMKLPVVVSAVDGVPELVEHEKTGLLIESGNVQHLAQSILRLIRDKEFATQLGENAHQKVATMMSAEKMVDDIESLYLELLDKKRFCGC